MIKKFEESKTGFLDIFLNIALLFAILFAVAVIQMDPEKEKTRQFDIPKQAQYLLMIEWTPLLAKDIDLHVLAPNEDHIYFQNKQTTYANLERDDLGVSNDRFKDRETGKLITIPENKEILIFRGFEEGYYVVNLHYYRDGMMVKSSENVKVTFMRLNPFDEVVVKTMTLEAQGVEKTAFRFYMQSDGAIKELDEDYSQKFVERSVTHDNGNY